MDLHEDLRRWRVVQQRLADEAVVAREDDRIFKPSGRVHALVEQSNAIQSGRIQPVEKMTVFYLGDERLMVETTTGSERPMEPQMSGTNGVLDMFNWHRGKGVDQLEAHIDIQSGLARKYRQVFQKFPGFSPEEEPPLNPPEEKVAIGELVPGTQYGPDIHPPGNWVPPDGHPYPPWEEAERRREQAEREAAAQALRDQNAFRDIAVEQARAAAATAAAGTQAQGQQQQARAEAEQKFDEDHKQDDDATVAFGEDDEDDDDDNGPPSGPGAGGYALFGCPRRLNPQQVINERGAAQAAAVNKKSGEAIVTNDRPVIKGTFIGQDQTTKLVEQTGTHVVLPRGHGGGAAQAQADYEAGLAGLNGKDKGTRTPPIATGSREAMPSAPDQKETPSRAQQPAAGPAPQTPVPQPRSQQPPGSSPAPTLVRQQQQLAPSRAAPGPSFNRTPEQLWEEFGRIQTELEETQTSGRAMSRDDYDRKVARLHMITNELEALQKAPAAAAPPQIDPAAQERADVAQNQQAQLARQNTDAYKTIKQISSGGTTTQVPSRPGGPGRTRGGFAGLMDWMFTPREEGLQNAGAGDAQITNGEELQIEEAEKKGGPVTTRTLQPRITLVDMPPKTTPPPPPPMSDRGPFVGGTPRRAPTQAPAARRLPTADDVIVIDDEPEDEDAVEEIVAPAQPAARNEARARLRRAPQTLGYAPSTLGTHENLAALPAAENARRLNLIFRAHFGRDLEAGALNQQGVFRARGRNDDRDMFNELVHDVRGRVARSTEFNATRRRVDIDENKTSRYKGATRGSGMVHPDDSSSSSSEGEETGSGMVVGAKRQRPLHLIAGSEAAKLHMARLRAMRKKK